MPPKLKFETVKQFFTNNGCKLLSKTYQDNKKNLEYICKCGHKRISKFYNIKRHKQFNCKNCTINKYFINGDNNLHMHPKTFKKIIKVMESKFKKSLKYRNRFKSSEVLKCSLCKYDKKIMYYFPANLNKKNNSLRCRFCNNTNHTIRRANHTQEQVINKLLNGLKNSAKSREKKGRTCEFKLTSDDIYNLIEKQNNKCAYSNIELKWEYNHPHKASIDRINSDKGYTIDNVHLVSHISNQAKSDLTEKNFLEMIKQIYEHKIKDNPELQAILNNNKIVIKQKPKIEIKVNPKPKPTKNKQPTTCTDCNKKITKGSTRCASCASKNLNKRKVKNRPSLETLLEDLKTLPYTKVGLKYGVSDNCIRKWIKQYQKNL